MSFYKNGIDIYTKDLVKLIHILNSNDIVKSINDNFEDLINIIPEIQNMVGFEHNHPHHHLNVWEHTLYALSLSPNNFEIRLALLLHDVGKPFCFQEGSDGVRHFKGHAVKSAIISKAILARLAFKENYIKEICKLISLHDTPLLQSEIDENPRGSYIRFCVQKCDALAHNPEKNERRLAYIEKMEKSFKPYKKSLFIEKE